LIKYVIKQNKIALSPKNTPDIKSMKRPMLNEKKGDEFAFEVYEI
tara:strand:- start:2107 stop:2241 length:135 start_codon:yes stop_codon:yes gene_type:complete